MKLKEKIILIGGRALGLMSQDQDHHNPLKTVTPGMPELLRSVAAQGAVLLENRVLPLANGTRISVGSAGCSAIIFTPATVPAAM